MKTRASLKCFVNDCWCSHMDVDGFSPVTASSRQILDDGDGCLIVIADAFGWMVLDGCGWLWVDSGGFERSAVLVPTVKFIALNLKVVDNCGKFL